MIPRPPGPGFHTLTAIARRPPTGRLGIATATRSLAVGARVPFVKPRLGAVATMAIADTRLGPMAGRLLETGYKAPAVIEQLVVADPYHEYRQLGVIDGDGFTDARTGAMNRDWAGHHCHENFIALGNVPRGEHILDAIREGFQAGRDAGGQKAGGTPPPSWFMTIPNSPGSTSASTPTTSRSASSAACSRSSSRRSTIIRIGRWMRASNRCMR